MSNSHGRGLAAPASPSFASDTPRPVRGGGAPPGAGVVGRGAGCPRKGGQAPRVALRRATSGDFRFWARASGDRRDALRTTDPADFAAFTCPASSQLTSGRAS
uniref:Uncharacterized protein n=1 Tax=Rhodopseudomonas palustris (strain BisA53) TaxID=316055 RepID=Q07M54_RHOP5